MKKIIIILLLTLTLFSLHAYKFRENTDFGFELGPNLTSNNTQTWGDDYCSKYNSEYKPGFRSNLIMISQISKKYNLQSKLGYIYHHAKDEFTSELFDENGYNFGSSKISYEYFLNQANVDIKITRLFFDRLSIGVGGFTAFPVFSQKVTFNAKHPENTIKESFSLKKSYMNVPHAGFSGELKYQISHYFISANYNYAANKLVKKNRGIGTFFNIKPRSLDLTIGYMFK